RGARVSAWTRGEQRGFAALEVDDPEAALVQICIPATAVDDPSAVGREAVGVGSVPGVVALAVGQLDRVDTCGSAAERGSGCGGGTGIDGRDGESRHGPACGSRSHPVAVV